MEGKMEVDVTYLWHSGFVVEMEGAVFVFDRWIEPGAQYGELPAVLRDKDPATPVYIFVSHFHKDHYNPEIFVWSRFFRDIQYMISKDVAKLARRFFSPTSVFRGNKIDPDKVHVCGEGDILKVGEVKVCVYGSTDVGNSYLVEVGGCHIFHAGDLNLWVSPGEDLEEETAMRRKFGEVLSGIEKGEDGESKRIDIAFFPVDSRLGGEWWEGPAEFVSRLRPRYLFPMHLCGGETADRTARLRDAARQDLYSPGEETRVALLTESGQKYTITNIR